MTLWVLAHLKRESASFVQNVDDKRVALARFAETLAASDRRAVNPDFIPRNHRIEAVIQAAVEQGNFAPFEELGTVPGRGGILVGGR